MPQTFNVGSRSVFVTTVAWVFIALALLASASAVVQNAAVASLLPGWQVSGTHGGRTVDVKVVLPEGAAPEVKF